MKNSISIFICQLTCVVHLSFKNLFNFALTHHTFFIWFIFFLIDVLPLNAWFVWNLWLVLFAICWSSFSCQLNNLSKRRKQQQYVEKKGNIESIRFRSWTQDYKDKNGGWWWWCSEETEFAQWDLLSAGRALRNRIKLPAQIGTRTLVDMRLASASATGNYRG